MAPRITTIVGWMGVGFGSRQPAAPLSLCIHQQSTAVTALVLRSCVGEGGTGGVAFALGFGATTAFSPIFFRAFSPKYAIDCRPLSAFCHPYTSASCMCVRVSSFSLLRVRQFLGYPPNNERCLQFRTCGMDGAAGPDSAIKSLPKSSFSLPTKIQQAPAVLIHNLLFAVLCAGRCYRCLYVHRCMDCLLCLRLNRETDGG